MKLEKRNRKLELGKFSGRVEVAITGLDERGKKEMTEQDLVEKIAEAVDSSRCGVCNNCGTAISTDNPDNTAKEIFTLIKEALPELAKEAGYKSPEECIACANKFADSFKDFTTKQEYNPEILKYKPNWSKPPNF